MQLSPSTRFLELAIFRFEDVCVNVQQGMEGYLKTAALEKKAGVEATMRWLRRRGVRIALVTHYDREELSILLERLEWGVGEDQLIQLAVLKQKNQSNSVKLAFETSGVESVQQVLLVTDNDELLRQGQAVGIDLVFGVTNGGSTYQSLAQEPFYALLDSTVQLPNYLLQNLPENNLYAFRDGAERNSPPRLWYPASGA